MISFKGEYEEALRVMRVARRKLLLFLPNFGAIAYFFLGRTAMATEYKGGNLLRMRGIVRMSQSLIWGGGGEEGSCKVYRDTAKICVIRSEFSPMALETFTSHGEKKSLCWEV